MGVSVDQLRASLLALPGVTEAPCYGTPSFRLRGKLFARLWPDGATIRQLSRTQLFSGTQY